MKLERRPIGFLPRPARYRWPIDCVDVHEFSRIEAKLRFGISCAPRQLGRIELLESPWSSDESLSDIRIGSNPRVNGRMSGVVKVGVVRSGKILTERKVNAS